MHSEVLNAELWLPNMLSRTAEAVTSFGVSEEAVLNEMNIVFTIADMVWYYTWFIYMTKREVGQLLLMTLIERYWPSLFSLLTKYITRKGVDLEKALRAYISRLLRALENLREEITKCVI